MVDPDEESPIIAGDKLAIVFKKQAKGGLAVEYRKNGAAFYTQDTTHFGCHTATSVKSNCKLDADNYFPMVIFTGFYTGQSAPIKDVTLLVD